MKLSKRMMAVADAWQKQKEYPPDATGGLRGYSAEVAKLEEEKDKLKRATDALIAENARVIADKHEGKTKAILQAYADILEGK